MPMSTTTTTTSTKQQHVVLTMRPKKRKAEETEDDLGSMTKPRLEAFAAKDGVFNLGATDFGPIPELGPVNQAKLAAAGITTPAQLMGKFLLMGRPAFEEWLFANDVGNVDSCHGESKRHKKYAALVEAWYVSNVG